MLFTSPVFLFIFLPALLLLYVAVGKAFKNPLLLLASLVFYAWGEVFYVGLLIASILINYAAGLAIDRFRTSPYGKWVLGLACSINLLLLVCYKYANFIAENFNKLTGGMGFDPWQLEPVHLPIGISFFTFQALSYLIDVWRGTSKVQRNLFNLALYISLFPQLIAGPIVRYHDIDAQIRERRVTIDGFYFGFRRFIFGLAKKMLIANPLGFVADQIFAIPGADLDASLTWLGSIAYTLQLYFDFSAYSCMAIGLGRMFGFTFLENFNYPYVSQSIQEFWRRWHISLSNWFRDYLYIPLGGNRAGSWQTYSNLLIVFFLCGLWHGASWNFVIWGMFHGIFLVLERAWLAEALKQVWRPFRHLYLLIVVMVAWVFFRADTLPYALDYVQAMFGFGEGLGNHHNARYFLTADIGLTILVGIVFATPIWPMIERWIDCSRKDSLSLGVFDVAIQLSTFCWVLAMGVLCVINVAVGTYNPFIYFRF